MVWNPFKRETKQHTGHNIVEVKTKNVTLGTSNALGSFLMFGTETASTASGAINLYEQSSAVAIPVDMIADHLQQLEPVLKEVGTNDVILKHPLLDLLRRPSPVFTTELFLQKITIDYLVTGEAPIIAIGNTNHPPIELQPVSPSVLNVSEGTDGFAAMYQIAGNTLAGVYEGVNEKRVRRYFRDPITELRLIRRHNTKNNSLLRGQSVLVSASKEVRQNIAGGEYNLSLLKNGGKVSMVFHFEDDMTKEVFDAMNAEIQNKFGGPQNANRIGMTSGGKMNIEQMGTSNRDMDFEKLQIMTKLAVAQAYHIPLPLMTTSAMTLNNYAEAKLALFDDAILPVAKKLLNDLGQWLLPRYGVDPAEFRLTFDAEQVEPLIDRRNSRLKVRTDLNLETRNELRRELPNRPDVEGGNIIMVPGTMASLESVALSGDAEPFDLSDEADETIRRGAQLSTTDLDDE